MPSWRRRVSSSYECSRRPEVWSRSDVCSPTARQGRTSLEISSNLASIFYRAAAPPHAQKDAKRPGEPHRWTPSKRRHRHPRTTCTARTGSRATMFFFLRLHDLPTDILKKIAHEAGCDTAPPATDKASRQRWQETCCGTFYDVATSRLYALRAAYMATTGPFPKGAKIELLKGGTPRLTLEDRDLAQSRDDRSRLVAQVAVAHFTRPFKKSSDDMLMTFELDNDYTLKTHFAVPVASHVVGIVRMWRLASTCPRDTQGWALHSSLLRRVSSHGAFGNAGQPDAFRRVMTSIFTALLSYNADWR